MKNNLKIERKMFLVMAGVLLSLLVSSGVTHPQGDTTIRWDIVSVQPPNVMAGGSASALANNSSKITLTGSGTFALFDTEDVTGGGMWRTSNKDGTVTGVGTYRVVRCDLMPDNTSEG